MSLSEQTPVIFVHGLWLHASSWHPWLELFDAEGYAAVAPGWPDEGVTVREARENPQRVANQSIDQIVAHFEQFAGRLHAEPILIGHSFGGLIVEKMLGMGIGRAGIAIDPALIKGLLPLPLARLRSALPALANPLNLTRAVSLTKSEFRHGFGNAISETESDALWERWSIPSPARPLLEAAAASIVLHAEPKVKTDNDALAPLLLIAGKADLTVPDVTTRAAIKQYRHSLAVTELKQFEGRSHSLIVDGGWRDVALACLAWLNGQKL